jgi:hypothetical protein
MHMCSSFCIHNLVLISLACLCFTLADRFVGDEGMS